MNLLDRRRAIMMMGLTKKETPYDAEISYLQSTGTQFIEIPFGFFNEDEVYMFFSIDTTMGEDKYMIAPKVWNDANNRFCLGVHRPFTDFRKVFTIGYGIRGTNTTVLQPEKENDGEFHSWLYKDYRFEVTDLNLSLDVSSYFFGSESKNLKLFFGHNAGTKGKISYYKHIKNGATVIELIPVRIGRVGYMYDKVSGQLFGNNGTGDFILGNDI